MEFRIQFSGEPPDPTAIENVVQAVDPSALVDIDPAALALRVATSIDGPGLAELISQAGYPVTPQQVIQLASVCCGGCSG